MIAGRADAEAYEPGDLAYQYRHRADLEEDVRWYVERFDLSVQDVTLFAPSDGTDPYFVLLSSEGNVYHFAPERYQERIRGAGTSEPDSKFYGKTLAIAQIGTRLYACGAGGQIYVRDGRDTWRLLTDEILLDREKNEAVGGEEPPFLSDEWAEWIKRKALNPASPNVLINAVGGAAEDAIYLCGVVGNKPFLAYWDGQALEHLRVPVSEGALTSIHVEEPGSVWICGREGLILHGSRARGFNPIAARTRLNLFHQITSYRGKLVLPASVRPGGLYELNLETETIARFDPPLPALRQSNDPDEARTGPFFAQAYGDTLWVVGLRDIYRFDGNEWERIEHPDVE